MVAWGSPWCTPGIPITPQLKHLERLPLLQNGVQSIIIKHNLMPPWSLSINSTPCSHHSSLTILFHAVAAAKLLQSCPTLWNPRDSSPPGSAVPGILQARTLEWVAISFSSAWKWKVKVKSLSRVRLLATPWTAAYQAPPSMGFSRQEYWSGVPTQIHMLLSQESHLLLYPLTVTFSWRSTSLTLSSPVAFFSNVTLKWILFWSFY